MERRSSLLGDDWPVVVTTQFNRFCEKRGFIPIARAADKYGSVVWECSHTDELQRHITLSFSPADREHSTYYASCWINANDGRHYTRQQYPSAVFMFVARIAASSESDNPTILTVSEGASLSLHRVVNLDFVFPLLDEASREVERITEADLKEEYPVPFAQ